MNTRGKRYHPVKPARSYKEQLARLTDIHGLTIEDEARARYILSTVNYYRLTTYGKHLRRADDPDLFLPGVSLETLYGLYRFDMNLRHLLLPVLEFFEVQLRAKIAYQLAITYGSLGYMDAENFRAEVPKVNSSTAAQIGNWPPYLILWWRTNGSAPCRLTSFLNLPIRLLWTEAPLGKTSARKFSASI